MSGRRFRPPVALSLGILMIAGNLLAPAALAPDAAGASTWKSSPGKDFGGPGSFFYNCSVNGTGAEARLALSIDPDGFWEEVRPDPSPPARSGHAMAAIAGTDKVLMYGGYQSGSWTVLNDTWLYDVGDAAWTLMSPSSDPSGRAEFAMATLWNDDRVVLFGGWGDTKEDSFINATWVYDLSDDEWYNVAPAGHPTPRYLHAMASVPGCSTVVLYGGRGYETRYPMDTWTYDPGANRWSVHNLPGLYEKSACAMAGVSGDDRMVLFGGGQTGWGSTECWVYDLGDAHWTRVYPPETPPARFLHSMAGMYDGDSILLFGGIGSTTPYSDLGDTWMYDPSENLWELKEPAKRPLSRCDFGLAAAGTGGKVVLFGGSNGAGDLGDTWVYDPNVYFWNATYLSPYHDCEREARPMSISWTADTPPDTSVRFQIKTATTSQGLSAETFIGPDGTPYSYYDSPSIVTNASSGKCWLQYKAELRTTNRSRAPSIIDVTVGYNRAPLSPDGLRPMNGVWTNESRPTFSWRFRDNDSSAQGGFVWEAFEDRSLSSPCMASGVVDSPERSFRAPEPFPDGTYYWRVATRDIEGDFGPPSDLWELRVDTAPPRAFSPVAAPAGWTGLRQTISFSTADELSGLDHFELWMDGTCLDEAGVPETLPELSDGKHEVVVRAYDQAGNFQDGLVRVYTDRTPPAPFILVAEPGNWTNRAPAVSFSPHDAASGIDHCELAVDGGPFSVQASPFILPELPDGAHEVTVRAFDLAGNFRDGTVAVRIDRTAPANLVVRVDPPGWTRDDPFVLFQAGDNQTRIERYELKVDDGDFTLQTSPVVLAGLEDGIHVITVRAFDLAGNFVEGRAQAFIDRTPPLPFSPVAEPDGWANVTPVISFSASDAQGGAVTFEARVDAGPFVKVASPWPAALVGDGQHDITVRAKDLAGNYRDGNVTVFIDREPPARLFLAVNNGAGTTGRRNVTLGISATDASSGLGGMCFSNDGRNYTAWEPFAVSTNWTLSPGEGKKTVFVKVRDGAGNEAPAVSAEIRYALAAQDDILARLSIPISVLFGISVVISFVALRRRSRKPHRD